MKNFLFRNVCVMAVMAVSLVFTSCGDVSQKQIVKDVKLETTLVDGDVLLSVGASFDFGNMSLTSITLPVIDPRDPDRVYGQISFKPTLDNYNEIKVTVNLSNCAQIPGQTPRLPNGNELPIGGLDSDGTHIVELKIDQINSSIYIALDSNLTMLGFAISIKEFDVLSSYIGGANIFIGFDIKGVRGMAGLYTGKDTMSNGLGFFVDLSSVITVDMLNDLIEGIQITPAEFYGQSSVATSWSQQYHSQVKSAFKSKLPSKRTQDELGKILYKMHKKKLKLHYVREE